MFLQCESEHWGCCSQTRQLPTIWGYFNVTYIDKKLTKFKIMLLGHTGHTALLRSQCVVHWAFLGISETHSACHSGAGGAPQVKGMK